MITNNQKAYLALVRAGLWEEVNDNQNHNTNLFKDVNWMKVYDLAEEQGVAGLVIAGIDSLNADVPLDVKLQLVGSALQTEKRNKDMDAYL